MKSHFFLLFFILCTPLFAQKGYFAYKVVTDGDDKNLSFPIFKPKNDTFTVEKINQLLQLSELYCIQNKRQKSIFEKVQDAGKGSVYGGRTDIAFTIPTNTNRLLSVSFDNASSGMTTHYWQVHYNFNAQNGDLIQLKELFDPNTFATFYKKALKKGFAQVKQSLPKKEDYEKYANIYKYDLDDDPQFYIKNNTIYIDYSGSYHKNDLFLGIDMEVKMKISESLPYLNDYGRFILGVSNDTTTIFHSTSVPQLFTGKIGEAKVLLVVNHYGGNAEAEYLYTKYGEGIMCRGHKISTTLSLIEENADGKEIAKINAVIDGETIVGTWQSIDKKTTLLVNLKRK